MTFTDITGRRVPVRVVDYREEFASGTLAPDRIIAKDWSIATGQSESRVIGKLGGDYRVLDSSTWRSQPQDAEYLGTLMAAHPVTMHFYILANLQLRRAEGWFKVSEWSLPAWGTLRAYFRAERESGPYLVRLLHFKPNLVATDRIKWLAGEAKTLERMDSPVMKWDIDRNVVLIDSR